MGLKKDFRDFAAFLLEGNHPVGTCFVVLYEGETYLVTAKHVVESWETFGKKRGVYVRVNRIGPGTIKIPVPKKWAYHPDQSVDLAAVPFRPNNEDYNIFGVTIESGIANKQNCQRVQLEWPIQEREEVIFPAMMYQTVGDGDERNLPVIRSGHVALATEKLEGYYDGRTEYILIDSQIYLGNSGAPVFVLYDAYRPGRDDPSRVLFLTSRGYSQAVMLLGVLSASQEALQEIIEKRDRGKREKVGYYNLGISYVVPVEKLVELLKCQEIEQMSEKEEPARGPIKPIPVRHPAEKGITKKEFEKSLKKVSQRIKPKPSSESDQGNA